MRGVPRAVRIWNIDAGKELTGEVRETGSMICALVPLACPLGLHAGLNISGMDPCRLILLQFAAFLRFSPAA
jgi:hypothetical protein